MPLLILLVLDKLGESISLLNNLVVRLVILIVTTGALFASFHVTAIAFSAFWMAAFVFRAIQMGLTYGDMSFDIVPRFAVLFPVAIGAHIANNIYASGGISGFITVISGHTVLAGTTLVVFGIYAFWAVEGLMTVVVPVWKQLVE